MSSMPSAWEARMTLPISSSRFSSISFRMLGLANMISTAGTREMPGLMLGSSFWQTMACRFEHQRLADQVARTLREEVEHAGDGLGAAGGMHGAEHQVAGLGRVQSGHEGFGVAHLADQHDVGVLAHEVLERLLEVFTSTPTSRWLISAFLSVKRYSIGSSMVTMWQARWALT